MAGAFLHWFMQKISNKIILCFPFDKISLTYLLIFMNENHKKKTLKILKIFFFNGLTLVWVRAELG